VLKLAVRCLSSSPLLDIRAWPPLLFARLQQNLRHWVDESPRVSLTHESVAIVSAGLCVDPDAAMQEMVSRPNDLALDRLAPTFATCAGGTTRRPQIDRDILPMYRPFSARQGSNATILAYQDGHGLRKYRERMADGIVP